MPRWIYDINAEGKIIQEDEVPEGWYPTPKASWEAKAALETEPEKVAEAPKEKAPKKKKKAE